MNFITRSIQSLIHHSNPIPEQKLVLNPNAVSKSNPYHLPVQEALIEYFASVLDESDRILAEASKLEELNENSKYEALTAEQQKALKVMKS
jgi:hypothetical protein